MRESDVVVAMDDKDGLDGSTLIPSLSSMTPSLVDLFAKMGKNI